MGFRGLACGAVVLAACSFDASGPGFLPAGGDDDDGPSAPDAGIVGSPDAAPLPPPPPMPDAAPPAPQQGVIDSYAPPAGLDLDGDLGEWPASAFRSFGVGDAAHAHMPGPGYTPSADVRFAIAHSATHIYFAIEVTDDVVVAPPEEPDDSYRLWNDDSISLYLDFGGDLGGPFHDDDFEIVVASNGWYGQSPATPHLEPTFELQGSVAPRDDGYTLEFGIVKSSLGFALPSAIGFSLGVNDDDGLGPAGYDAIGVWYRNEESACPSCCPDHPDTWCDTSTLGSLKFR